MCSCRYIVATRIAKIAKIIRRRSILLFTQSKEMPGKSRKHMKKGGRRHTRRRVPRKGKKGGALESQSLIPPSSAFKHVTPLNSDNVMGKIA
jgi:hypothetical protein